MAEQVRIYQGNTVQTVPLEQNKPLSFGESKKCDHRFPRGSCPGNSITFSVQNGVWTVNCEGTVTCAGKSVTTALAHNGDTFILNAENPLAVQFVHQERRPAAQISLTELPELLVGRSANCTLQLNHKRISGSHAKFYPSGDQWHLCDVNSTNGTFVNGKRIRECALQERDVIVIGPYDLIFTNGMLEVFGEAGTVTPHLPLNGKLWLYLADLNEQAQNRFERIIEQMRGVEGVTEDMKQYDQMAWVGIMNNIRNRAEEIIISEMIYH